MNDPTAPSSPDSSNKAFTILRIVLWLMPAIFIPVSFLITGLLIEIMYNDKAFILAVLLPIIPTIFIGYLDQRISLMQQKIAPPHDKKELARWTAIFVLLQIIIAPTVCWAVIYGFCMVTGVL